LRGCRSPPRSAGNRPATHCRRAPSRRCWPPPWRRAGDGGARPAAWSFGRVAARETVVAPRRFRRDVARGDVVHDRTPVARARIAPAAAARGAEGEAVARLQRHAGRLQELLLAAVAAREDRLVDGGRLAAVQ